MCRCLQLRQLGLLLLAILPMQAAVQAQQDNSPLFVSIQLENDFFANTGDRHYTHGSQLAFAEFKEPSRWMADLAELAPLYRHGERLNMLSYTLGQKLFTPENIHSSELQEDDRPYAAYSYLSFSLMSQLEDDGRFKHGNMLELTLGLVGPAALGAQLQTESHRLFGNALPEGWDHQLNNELILGLAYTSFWRSIRPLGQGGLQLSSVPHLGLSLGNAYTHASAGGLFRFGTRLDRDLSPPSIGPGFPGLALFETGGQSSWYLYAGLEGRWVLRDIFLDGNSLGGSHRIEKEPLVADLQYGLVWTFERFRLSLSQMRRSPEFKGQRRNTHYGALNLTFGLH
ncbi:MAG: lipid A deacylase LpxR family protein [Thiohalomonadaceae bacterium]